MRKNIRALPYQFVSWIFKWRNSERACRFDDCFSDCCSLPGFRCRLRICRRHRHPARFRPQVPQARNRCPHHGPRVGRLGQPQQENCAGGRRRRSLIRPVFSLAFQLGFRLASAADPRTIAKPRERKDGRKSSESPLQMLCSPVFPKEDNTSLQSSLGG